MLEIYYINLDRRPDRRSFMEEQFRRLGIEATRFPAIETPSRSSATLKPVEVACLDSHIALWREAISRKKPILVLEDDALLSSSLPDFLSMSIDWEDGDVVRIEAYAPALRMGSFRSVGGYQLRRLLQSESGAAAYIITPAAAAAYLRAADFMLPIDGLMFADPMVARTRVWQLTPGLAAQLDRLPGTDDGVAASDQTAARQAAALPGGGPIRTRLAQLRLFLSYPMAEWPNVVRKPLAFRR